MNTKIKLYTCIEISRAISSANQFQPSTTKRYKRYKQ